MKIDPGYYKIKPKRVYLETDYHYLRVYMTKGVKYLQIDCGDPITNAETEQEIIRRYDIMKVIKKPIHIRELSIKFSWTDEDGDRFNLLATDKSSVDRIFLLFPRLKGAYEKKDQNDSGK